MDMKYIVTSAEMQEYDNNTIQRMGIPALVLMERAALAVRDEILRMAECSKDSRIFRRKVLIAAGNGNNGADGLALARLLKEQGFEVSVLECGSIQRATESYKRQRDILGFFDICFLDDISEVQSEYDFVVDGIFGIGLTREVNGKYAEIIDILNRLSGIKVAIDMPSGIDGTLGTVLGCAFRADVTVTFGFGKRGLYLCPGAEYAGNIKVTEIGINKYGFFGHEPKMFTYDEDLSKLLPNRKRDGNKGTFGKVLLIAGWENMAGAAVMSAQAVLKTGAGMLKVFCGEKNRGVLQCTVPEAMYGDIDTLCKDIHWADVIVAGPGMGQSEEAAQVLKLLLENVKNKDKKLVLDADALNLLAGFKAAGECADGISAVMTPHIGELSRLTGKDISYVKSNLVEVAKEAALDYDSVMVCKDARTYVHGKEKAGYLNITGNSGMATAGSGDVLAGVIGGLLAQGQEEFEASCTGVYLHGLAGDAGAKKVSEYSLTATKLIAQIEEIMKGS